ncbi:MAG: 2-succinyl-6-hydroxy-2,4-cyclohexadiene-1-carboxylate synthase [candidate division Zixibacteria bacterium]|nr:2-succinyl-6-hydroxy-2,4-cyclohexadiene-1-carboxylate synthase [candidate division Zixibacteria bacterium]
MKLHFQVRGDQSNPAILFLHGFLGLGEDWSEIAQDLSRDHFCVLPDLPGHGQSRESSSDQSSDMAATSVAIVNLLDDLKIDCVALLGYSMGGRIALFTAIRFAHRVEALVLESASPGIEDDKERIDRAALDDLRAEQIERKGVVAFVEQWYNAPLFDSLHHQPEKLALLKQSRLVHDPHALAEALRGLSVGRQPSLWKEIVRLDIPTLVIAGTSDKKYCDIANKMAALLPQCRLITIGDAGHNTHFEQPQELLARLREFLHDTDA